MRFAFFVTAGKGRKLACVKQRIICPRISFWLKTKLDGSSPYSIDTQTTIAMHIHSPCCHFSVVRMVFVLGAFHRATASALLISGQALLAGGNRKGRWRHCWDVTQLGQERCLWVWHIGELLWQDFQTSIHVLVSEWGLALTLTDVCTQECRSYSWWTSLARTFMTYIFNINTCVLRWLL